MTVLLEIGIVLALILLNGFLAMSEMAMVSSRRGRLEQLASQGNRGARAAAQLIDDPTRFLSTVQVGITLVGILAGAFSGATLGAHLAGVLKDLGLAPATADTLAIVGVVLAITYLSLIVGELVPKRLALSNPEAIAARVARPMMLIAGLTAPLVWLLRASTNGVLRLLGIGERAETRVSEDEIRALLAEGAEAGVVKRVEHEMIEGIMRIADRPVRAIMTPRVEVLWLDSHDPPATVRKKIVGGGHTRYPVCRGDLDEIIGVLHLRKLVDGSSDSDQVDLAALAEPPLMVHEGASIIRVVELFRQTPVHMAIVLDEYGAVEGLVTPADDVAEAAKRSDGSWLVDGRMDIHRVERLLGVRGMGRDDEYATLAGFVLWELGRMPRVGESFVWHDLRFEVVDLDGRRIDKVLVQPAADGPAPIDPSSTAAGAA
jgi:putative hemolysin